MNNNTQPLKPGTAEWRKLITASKVATIMRTSPWETRAELWHRMTGTAPGQEVTPAMMRGTIQEDSIIRWFFEMLRPDIAQQSGEVTITRRDLPWAAANPDAVGIEDGKTVFVETKSVARAKVGDSERTEADEWGEPGTDQIPLYYYIQVLWQMHMSQGDGGDKVNRAYLIKHGPWVDQYDVYPIDYNPGMAAELERQAKAFYDSLEFPQCPYPVEDRANIHKFFANLHPDIEPKSEWEISYELAAQYIQARDAKKDAEAAEDGAKARILKAIGTARTATCNGVKIAYRRPTKTGVSLYPPQNPATLADINPAADAA